MEEEKTTIAADTNDDDQCGVALDGAIPERQECVLNPNIANTLKKLIPAFIHYLNNTSADAVSATGLANIAVDALMKRYVYQRIRQHENVRGYLLRVSNNEPWCWLCNMRIFLSIRDPNNPEAFSMDHLKPKGMGGPLTIFNILPAHRHCNMYRHSNPRTAKSKAKNLRKHANVLTQIHNHMMSAGIPFREGTELPPVIREAAVEEEQQQAIAA